MQEEFRTDGVQRNAGEGSPERSGGANKSGGEPSPASPPPGAPPGQPAVGPFPRHPKAEEDPWGPPHPSADVDWEDDPPPPSGLEDVPGLGDLPLPRNLTGRPGPDAHRAAVAAGAALAAAEGVAAGYLAAEWTAGARLWRAGQHLAPHALCLEATVRGAWPGGPDGAATRRQARQSLAGVDQADDLAGSSPATGCTPRSPAHW